ncbi:DUF3800 domain-containing protein [Lysinibacillus xylanilyticus]|uniref:DUF3800 domain-containing protein n=1 Tax=Lysinibacillus xylanilyticus TaxID=582475 RepID=A0A2M9QA22_9BACI|nr:DUF3800 domain-containing protein [Lysinibacillus xylanilyticus]PJO44918.1 hypothetical protein CWD94_04325 [Lysinibacillus xylanilyticus]
MLENLRETIISLSGLTDKVNKNYNFFFDETINIRGFSLTTTGFNNDESKFFVLGGIVVEEEIPTRTLDLLWDSIPESKKQDELKFKTIKQGAKDFPSILKKPYFQEVINWLYENNYWIHFQYMDNFYYSTVDIIDSLPMASSLGSIEHSRHFKTALYRAIKYDKEKSLDIFISNKYPDVKNPALFLSSIEELIDNYMKSDEYEAYYFEREDNTLKIIQREISQFKNQDLPFLVDNEAGKLIEEYYQLYLQRIILFNRAKLIFDHEVEVEKELNKLNIEKKNFRFVESSISKAKEKSEFIDEKTHKLVQLSDIVVGIMGMFLSYINSDATRFMKDINEASNWSEKQWEVYDKWISVINNSIRENSSFKMAVADEFLEYQFNFFTGESFKKCRGIDFKR